MWDGDSPQATFTLWFDSGFGGNEPMPGWASWIGRPTGRACRCNGFFKEIRCATHASKNMIVGIVDERGCFRCHGSTPRNRRESLRDERSQELECGSV